MKTSDHSSTRMSGMDILDLTMKELYQMCQMRDRICHVLVTHRDKDTKNEYLTDKELIKLYVMLNCLTGRHSIVEGDSEFDKEEVVYNKLFNAEQEEAPQNEADKRLQRTLEAMDKEGIE